MRAAHVLIAAAVLTSCVAVDPARKSQLDTWRESLKPQALTYPASNGSRIAISEGQWVEYLAVDEADFPSKIRYSVLNEEIGGRWLEVEQTDYYGSTKAKMLIEMDDWNSPSSWTIKRIVRQVNNEKPQELQSGLIGEVGDQQLGALKIQLKTDSAARETIVTPAGTFADTLRIRSKSTTTLGTFETMLWLHSAVPVTGWAKSRSRDGKLTMELTAFGLTGARSAIPL